jgi:hypothetical protein
LGSQWAFAESILGALIPLFVRVTLVSANPMPASRQFRLATFFVNKCLYIDMLVDKNGIIVLYDAVF